MHACSMALMANARTTGVRLSRVRPSSPHTWLLCAASAGRCSRCKRLSCGAQHWGSQPATMRPPRLHPAGGCAQLLAHHVQMHAARLCTRAGTRPAQQLQGRAARRAAHAPRPSALQATLPQCRRSTAPLLGRPARQHAPWHVTLPRCLLPLPHQPSAPRQELRLAAPLPPTASWPRASRFAAAPPPCLPAACRPPAAPSSELPSYLGLPHRPPVPTFPPPHQPSPPVSRTL